ncbi:hypothetical protein BHE74_00004532 [Ensete ventricosum]|nr:hypothetical protein BHE74_00004532 [Ensete ventricosum]RZR85047.1 hypothetical protein BHM03_00011981 [Ensete ventricosum]
MFTKDTNCSSDQEGAISYMNTTDPVPDQRREQLKNSNDSFGVPKGGTFPLQEAKPKQDEAAEQRTEQNRAAEVSHETTEGRGKGKGQIWEARR